MRVVLLFQDWLRGGMLRLLCSTPLEIVSSLFKSWCKYVRSIYERIPKSSMFTYHVHNTLLLNESWTWSCVLYGNETSGSVLQQDVYLETLSAVCQWNLKELVQNINRLHEPRSHITLDTTRGLKSAWLYIECVSLIKSSAMSRWRSRWKSKENGTTKVRQNLAAGRQFLLSVARVDACLDVSIIPWCLAHQSCTAAFR